MKRLLPAAAIAALIAACGTPRPAAYSAPDTTAIGAPIEVRTAADLVRQAKARHAATWYRTLTFRQTTTFFGEEGTRAETWIEALDAPGRLRIDLPEPGNGNIALYRGDSTYVFRDGEQVVARAGGNPLLTLGFDLYFLPTVETLGHMAAAGIDTTQIGTGTWAGRPAWIVGDDGGDATTPQVWYDRERLVFVRLILNEGEAVTDIRFEQYAEFAGGWIAPRVEIYTNGELVMTEDYHDMRAGVDLPPGTFSPVSGPAVRWWGE